MKQTAKTKILRKVLFLAFLIAGFVAVELDTSSYASAKTCVEAWNDHVTAGYNYESARMLYFYNEPNTCQAECAAREGSSTPGYYACVADCPSARYAALQNAEQGMFDTASDTCTPVAMEECTGAQQKLADCGIQYDYSSITDTAERFSVQRAYMACRSATKIDSCQ